MKTIQTLMDDHPELIEAIKERGVAEGSTISADELIEVAKGCGIDTSDLSFGEEGELSEDELLAVTGGARAKLCVGFGIVVNF